LQYATQQF